MFFEKTHWKHKLCHGGELRNKRAGRGGRPLSSKDPLHVVLKANRHCLGSGLRSYKRFFLIQTLVQRYSLKFYVKIEQISIQGDHIHLLLRASRRSQFQDFLRVLSGQIAQELHRKKLMVVTDTPGCSKSLNSGKETGVTKAKLWKHRPFSRVIKGWRAYQVVRDYIQLNEKEALGEIPYRKQRLRGLSLKEWQALWA